MSRWKEMKAKVRENYRKAKCVYELDPDHVFIRVNSMVSYDVNDQEYYMASSGCVYY